MRKNLHLLILSFFCFYNVSFSQFGWNSEYDPDNIIGRQLFYEVQAQFGIQYVLDYFVLDSMFNKDWVYDEITDPYNQLQGKVLFVAFPDYVEYNQPDSAIIGIFENGQIAWHSDYISIVKVDTSTYDDYYYYSVSAEIFAIRDINLDGSIDILLMCGGGLWIISWDGINGTIVNDIDPTSRSSNLLSSDSFRLINTNDDDILEILSYWFEYDSTRTIFPPINIPTRPYVTYGWNGFKYGLWENVIQLGFGDFPIADRLIGSVNSKIIFSAEEDSTFFYEYTVKNNLTSKQSIHTFVLDNMSDSKSVSLPFGEWFNFGFDSTGVGWSVKFPNQSVNSGESKNGFMIKSKARPNINKFYLRADGTRIVYGPDLGKQYNVVSEIDNYRTNSYPGYTVVPSDLMISLLPINMVDTLNSYNQRSYELGWITNQSTANKYDSLFTLAKTQLLQNNNNGARTTLQTVMQEVDIDSTDNLTSEAYALLRYNTEYLIEKIPPANPNLLVNLKNSLGNQIPASNVTYYESATSGWKDAVNNGDGTFTVITTKPTVSIRMFYEYANQTIHNVPAQNNTYTFQTVNAAVELKNSLGSLVDAGTVQYYAGAWRTFGTTQNGVAYKELLPINYSIRMTYEYIPNDKQQDISVNSTVTFSTVLCTVKVTNTNNQPLAGASTKYYSTAWRDIGLTNSEGIITKELLPKNLSFRATYGNITKDKQQDISVNSLVEILFNVP